MLISVFTNTLKIKRCLYTRKTHSPVDQISSNLNVLEPSQKRKPSQTKTNNPTSFWVLWKMPLWSLWPQKRNVALLVKGQVHKGLWWFLMEFLKLSYLGLSIQIQFLFESRFQAWDSDERKYGYRKRDWWRHTDIDSWYTG